MECVLLFLFGFEQCCVFMELPSKSPDIFIIIICNPALPNTPQKCFSKNILFNLLTGKIGDVSFQINFVFCDTESAAFQSKNHTQTRFPRLLLNHALAKTLFVHDLLQTYGFTQ